MVAPFYGELFSHPSAWSAERQAEFSADLCRLLIVCNIAWMAVEIPFWRAFFTKWLPECQMPGRRELSGRILDQESVKVLDNMKEKVKDHFGTGQCDGWKNINKTSIIGTMVNVEYEPYILNTIDVSALPKTATELLKLVFGEIKYMTETLKIKVTAWCTDASGESASMRRLLIQKMPSIIVVDCWAHQVRCTSLARA
ncbi:hypothetical protein M405DRAFT_746608 [Rhizopogon salebrosus TDB-379]|nr:hypothetical protein M405DRAFT_746608 [Rhizopogon salebrosus TDB-379]